MEEEIEIDEEEDILQEQLKSLSDEIEAVMNWTPINSVYDLAMTLNLIMNVLDITDPDDLRDMISPMYPEFDPYDIMSDDEASVCFYDDIQIIRNNNRYIFACDNNGELLVLAKNVDGNEQWFIESIEDVLKEIDEEWEWINSQEAN